MLVTNICKRANLTEKQGAIIQVSLFSIVFISMLVFPSLFVTLSIYLAILTPLFFFYVYVLQNIFQGFRTMNLAY